MIIYTNGCSHTHGYACVTPYLTWPHMVIRSLINDSNYLFFHKDIRYNNKFDIVKELLAGDSILLNEAQSGAGNDYILHHTIESVTKLINCDKKPNWVFIQWSGTNRRLHSTPYGTEMYVNPSDSASLGVKFEPMGSMHTCHYSYLLQEFLKSHNINYLFFNYMAWDSSVLKSSIFSKIDFNNWVTFQMGEDVIFNGLIDFFKEKNYTCDEPGHPNLEGSYYIAYHILKKLNKNILPLDKFSKKLL